MKEKTAVLSGIIICLLLFIGCVIVVLPKTPEIRKNAILSEEIQGNCFNRPNMSIPCNAGLNQICGEEFNITCATNLKCIGQSPTTMTCLCPAPFHQLVEKADPEFSSHVVCRGLVGSPCDKSHDFTCIPNASCITHSNGISYCQCEEGMAENNVRHCDLDFGARCLRNKPCVGNLVCNDGICNCRNSGDIYEQGRRRCASPVGARCFAPDDCVQYAYCVTAKLYDKFGICKCNKEVSYLNPQTNSTCIERI